MGDAPPLRVLFLTHSYPRVPGDAPGSFLLHLAVALREEGVDVRVVAPAAPGLPAHDTFGGIRVDRFRYAPRSYETLAYTGEMAQQVQRAWSAKAALVGFLGAQFALATRVRREWAPHLLHAHWWFPGGLVGSWVAGRGRLPLVTTMHGTDVRLARAKALARPLFRRVMHRSRAVTTVSRWLAAEVREMVPDVTPYVAPMPVSTALFAPGGERATDRLLFVGRLNAQKGVAALLDAVARMRHRVALDIVGDGPDAPSLREQAAALGIGERLTWHGALPQDALPPLYQRASALVVPSIGEGLGLVAVEAQLCGAPVVAFESGGLVDAITHGETGLLVPPGDIDALARALDRLFDDPELRLALGRAGRVAALGDFAPEAAARRYATLYRSALAP
ncbi:MAG TPA: glycosyltransferase [Gemmatimonadaceae bacterium]|nr:glycosyltransferase [Gemmatimonadaceae bacterium]